MVTVSTSVQTDLSKYRSICNLSEPQTSTVGVSSPRPKCLGHRCCKHKLDGSHCLCLPSDASPTQGDSKNQAVPLPDHCSSPRLARYVLVLGHSAALNRNPTSATSVNHSSQTVPQLCISQQSTTSQPPLPKWNLSVVINELTKAALSLWHRCQTSYSQNCFLTSFGHSEIYAWVANKVSNLGHWEKVALFPSSDFIAKNQLAREGSQSVSPVTIQRRQDIVSGAGPEVLFGSNQRPKGVSIPPFHFLQERTQTSDPLLSLG